MLLEVSITYEASNLVSCWDVSLSVRDFFPSFHKGSLQTLLDLYENSLLADADADGFPFCSFTALSTWCAAHPRCTDLQTGLVTAGNPACGTLRYGHQGGSSDHDGETTTGRGEPSTTRPSTSRGGNKPPSSNNQGLPSSASFRGSETTLRTDVSSNSPTESGIPDSLASSFVTQQSSPAKAPFSYLNITSFSTTTRTNEIGEPVTSTYTARINVLLNDNGSVITTLAQTLLPSTEVIEATSPSKSITDERAFADATPSSPFTSGTRRRMSLQPFNMRAGVLWLAWLITMLGRSR